MGRRGRRRWRNGAHAHRQRAARAIAFAIWLPAQNARRRLGRPQAHQSGIGSPGVSRQVRRIASAASGSTPPLYFAAAVDPRPPAGCRPARAISPPAPRRDRRGRRPDGSNKASAFARLVRLQRPDELQRDLRVPLAQCRPFGLGLLNPVPPNTCCPAAITGAIASAAKVFDTAMSVTDDGSRPAAAQAAAMSVRTAASRDRAARCSSIPTTAPIARGGDREFRRASCRCRGDAATGPAPDANRARRRPPGGRTAPPALPDRPPAAAA